MSIAGATHLASIHNPAEVPWDDWVRPTVEEEEP